METEVVEFKGSYIEDLQPGDFVKDSVFVVKNASEKTSNAGAPFITLQLADRTGAKESRKFNVTDFERAVLLSSKFVCVNGRVENNPKYSDQLIIDRVIGVQPADEAPFLKQLGTESIRHQEAFSKLLRSVNERHLNALLRRIFAGETWVLFRRAVAASSNHHEYPGGLLEHTLEVATLCDRVCSVLPSLRRDLLVTGALLHDIGKLEEMEHGVMAGQYTASGNLVGHIVSGAMFVSQTAALVEDFPKSLLDTLVHLILSHHGTPEFGAARKPAMAEAFVLAECDVMSARVHMCRASKAKAGAGQIAIKSHGDFVFVGDIEFDDSATVAPVSSYTVLRSYNVLESSIAVNEHMEDRDTAELETREAIPPAAGADYMLRVADDSMAADGIFENDLVFVVNQSEAADGQIVVVSVPGEGSVVKRLQYKDGIPAVLASGSDSMSYVPLTDAVALTGVVTGVIREYATAP